jgi:arsenate reductase-like glutaredoxin family protein
MDAIKEDQDIDFKKIEILSNAPSKKYLRKLIEYCFLVRNKVNCLDKFDRTPVTENFAQDLNISEADAHSVILKLQNNL